MHILHRGEDPDGPKQRTCPKCGTVFVYDEKDIKTSTGRRVSSVDKFRYTINHYTGGHTYIICPVCRNDEMVIEQLPDLINEVENW